MRAIRMHETGSPEVLQLDEVPAPVAVAGQAVIRVAVAGVNFTDVMARQGMYLRRDVAPQLPTVLGSEVAGVVTAVGAGVPDALVGRRVVAFVRGGYAEQAVAPIGLVTALPDGIDLDSAVACLVQGVSAWQLLSDCGRLQPGESVLVHSAAGGVGTLALQLARALGAGTVVAAAGSAEKRRLASELGADVAVDYGADDWPEAVLEATDGRGADVILDAVGGDVGERSLGCLAGFGRLVVYGIASKRLASFAGSQLMHRNQSVIGYSLTDRLGLHEGGRHVGETIVPRLLGFVDGGELRSVVRHAFPLEAAAAAHRAIAERQTVGKVVLTVE
jgi:NADPH2:quinone reductase